MCKQLFKFVERKNKVILEGKEACRRHRMTPKKLILVKVWTLASQLMASNVSF
jgi:hypothetical protein